MANRLYSGGKPQGQQDQEQGGPGQHIMSGMATYTMNKGDTLWGVSHAYGIPLEDLQAVNPHVGDPTKIPVGTVLNLPFNMQAHAHATQGGANGNQAGGDSDAGSGESAEHISEAKPAEPEDAVKSLTPPGVADNQPIDAETAKKYDQDPGTTWRVLNLGEQYKALRSKVANGTATRADATKFGHEYGKLRLEPNLSGTELRNLHSIGVSFFSLTQSPSPVTKRPVLSFEEVNHNPFLWDAMLSALDLK